MPSWYDRSILGIGETRPLRPGTGGGTVGDNRFRLAPGDGGAVVPSEVPTRTVTTPPEWHVDHPEFHDPDDFRLGEDFWRDLERRNAERKRLDLARKLARAKSWSARLSKRNLFFEGFQLGWQIGELIWGDPFAVFGPSGFWSPNYEILTYPENGGWDGQHCWFAGGSNQHTPGLVQGDPTGQWDPHTNLGVPGGYTQADIAVAIPLPTTFFSMWPSGFSKMAESWALKKNQGTITYAMGDPGHAIPGFGTPLKVETVPAEFPQLWPIGVPIAPPIPNTWEDSPTKPDEEQAPEPEPAPVPAPPLVPLPLIWVSPEISPAKQPDVVIIVDTPPDTDPGDDTDTDPDPGVDPDPEPEPAPAETIPGVQVLVRPNSSRRRPPKERKKEKKVRIAPGGKLWLAVNAATEILDLLDALMEGLPEKCRPKARRRHPGVKRKKGDGLGAVYYKITPDQQLRALWNCWDHFDPKAFLAAFINNQVEDMVYGGIGVLQRKAEAGLGLNTGGSGPAREVKSQTGKQPKDDADPIGSNIPQLTYDPETDTFQLTVFGQQFGGH